MRIVMVCPSYPPRELTCGVGDYTRCLAEELARGGDDVTVVTSTGYAGPRTGVVRVLPVLGDGAEPRRWWDAGDVLDVQYAPDLYRGRSRITRIPLLARFARGGPSVVVTFHTLLDGSLGARLAVPWLLATAAHSISANEEVSAMIRRRLPGLAKRCTEIPRGSPTAFPSSARGRRSPPRISGTATTSPSCRPGTRARWRRSSRSSSARPRRPRGWDAARAPSPSASRGR